VDEVTKAELVNEVAKIGLTKRQAAEAVEAMLEAIKGALAKGEKVQLIGFGSFDVRERRARKGRNPKTGIEIDIPAKKVPIFRPGSALRDRVK
jgi:DNA-binding protein HU-beta